MSTMTKVFIVLTSVMAVVVSCLFVASAAQWSNAKETIQSYQTLYQAELVRRMNLEGIMAVSLATKDDELRQRDALLGQRGDAVRDLTNQVAEFQNRLASESNRYAAAEAGRKKLEEILGVQTAELTSTQKQNQVLLTQNIDLQTRNQRLGGRQLELTSQLTIATDEIRNLQEKLYASEQKMKELQQAMAVGPRRAKEGEAPKGAVAVKPVVAGPIEGEIVEIDGRYVSINVGDTSGVIEGMPFMVYRDGTYVADLVVETVRPKEAGGKLTLLKPGEQVRRGDRVAYGMN